MHLIESVFFDIMFEECYVVNAEIEGELFIFRVC